VPFQPLPFNPHHPSPLPHYILRLHIRSLGYQQLSSGGVPIVTCIHQRRLGPLNQTQSEGEVGQLRLDKGRKMIQGRADVAG
jgi:hypothetical protein